MLILVIAAANPDCNNVKCPLKLVCPEGSKAVSVTPAIDDCCERFECRDISKYLAIA